MSAIDIIWFVLIILILVGVWILLNRIDKRTKNKHKKNAYKLLDTPDASRDEIRKNIKMLRLYGGRWRKDKEFMQLINKLIDRLDEMDKKETAQIK